MSRRLPLCNPLLLVLACAALAPAQITVFNTASAPPALFQATVGPDISIDPANAKVGGASFSRASSVAANSYLPTGWAINPTQGFTIQFWYRPLQASSFGYLLGDSSMVSPLGGYSGGRFRLFQSGACYCPAYTPTNSGGLTLRGVPNEASVVGTPLTTQTDPNGWIHIGVRYDPLTNVIDILLNGIVATSTPQTAPFNWMGTNLDILGDRGSTSAAAFGNYDDFRIYTFARPAADIFADYLTSAAGMGPSGLSNVPDQAYYEGELSVNNHVCQIGTNGDPVGLRDLKATAGTLVEWTGNCVNLPGVPASCLINVWPGGTSPGCATPGVPGVALCHNFSVPSGPALIFPDALGLSAVNIGAGINLPYMYGGPMPSASLILALPPAVFTPGDAIALQFIAPDGGYPNQIGTSNVMRFRYVDPIPGPHAHIEARGNGAIQVLGFWELHATGTVDITRVVVDCSLLPTIGFNPAGALNSGGTLAAGTSYRFGTEVTTGLQGLPAGFTGTVPLGTGFQRLQWDFTSFNAPTDELIFDCDSLPANGNGNIYIGAQVTVTFADQTVLMGTLAADPADPVAAVLDL